MADKTVYSTGPQGPEVCFRCGKAVCECVAGISKTRTQTEPVRISFKNAKGSGLTLVERLPMHPQGKEDLLKRIKKRLGVGGTVKNGVLEIQGEHKDFVKTELEASGYKVRVL
jgi:translation initiation factor 1